MVGIKLYITVAGISHDHDIAFGMYHVEYKGISYDHVVCLLIMLYIFVDLVCFFKQQQTSIYDL